VIITLGLSANISAMSVDDDVAASNKYDDPDSVDKCYPLPTESSNFLSFDGEFIYQEL
jgi:hypothetical protein